MASRFERGRDLQEMQVSLNMFSGAMDNLGARCPAIKAVREALSVAARPTKARKGVAR